MPASLIDPILAAVAVAAAIFTGLVLLEARLGPPRVGPGQVEGSGESLAPRARSRRRLGAVVAVVALASVAVYGVIFVKTYDPLRVAGPGIGSGPLYLGTIPATYGGLDSIGFAAVPGGDVRLEFSLMNTGDFPLTVVGLMDPDTNQATWSGGIFASGLIAPYGSASDGAFHRFQIEPNSIAAVTVSLRLGCFGRIPTPTLAPEKSPSAAAALAAQGWRNLAYAYLPIGFEAFGIEHQVNLSLPFYISLAVVDQSGCDGGQDGSSLPGGLYVTPVPSIAYP